MTSGSPRYNAVAAMIRSGISGTMLRGMLLRIRATAASRTMGKRSLLGSASTCSRRSNAMVRIRPYRSSRQSLPGKSSPQRSGCGPDSGLHRHPGRPAEMGSPEEEPNDGVRIRDQCTHLGEPLGGPPDISRRFCWKTSSGISTAISFQAPKYRRPPTGGLGTYSGEARASLPRGVISNQAFQR